MNNVGETTAVRLWMLSMFLLATACGWGAIPTGERLDIAVEIPATKLERGLFDEYEPTFWDVQSGLPYNQVTAIYVDQQGYLWLGSYFGVIRFNGVDFEKFTPYNSNLKSDTVTGICKADDEHFWISTTHGLFKSNGRDFTENRDLPEDCKHIVQVLRTSDGVVWLATTGGVLRIVNGALQEFDAEFFGSNGQIQGIGLFRSDEILVSGSGKLAILDPDGDAFSPLSIPDPGGGLEASLCPAVIEDSRGRLWYRDELGIQRISIGGEKEVVVPPPPAPSSRIRILANLGDEIWTSQEDGTVTRHRDDEFLQINLNSRFEVTLVNVFCKHNDNYWLGSEEGLVRLQKRAVTNYSLRSGLPDRYAGSVVVRSTNEVMVGTHRGFAIINPHEKKVIPRVLATADNYVRSLCPDPDGGIWISNEEFGPLKIDRDLRQVYASTAMEIWEDASIRVWCLMYDSQDTLWAGIETGAIQFLEDGGYRYFHPDGDPAMPAASIRCIYEHTDGSMWMGSGEDGLVILRDGRFEHYTKHDGISGQEVFAIVPSPDAKTVWLATDEGITQFQDGAFRSFGHADGVPEGTINHILFEVSDGPDRTSYMWLTSLAGVHRLDPKELGAYSPDSPGQKLEFLTVNAHDGMLNAETNGEQQPAGAIDAQGNLWVPTIKGVVRFDPSQYSTGAGTTDPPIIESIVVTDARQSVYNNATAGPGMPPSELVLEPDHRDLLEIKLAAPDVDLVDRAEYEYQFTRLGDNPDQGDWRKLSGSTVVQTTLQPGSYQFSARVASSKRSWSPPTASMVIHQQPYFYEKRSFFALLVILAVAGAVYLHLWRMRYASRIQQLEQRAALIAERERIARDMHDDLGSRLTHISLLAEISERTGNQLTSQQTRELNAAARQAARAVEEVVWAAKPDNDSMGNTIDYLIQYAEHQLEMADIACRNRSPQSVPPTRISPEIRQTILLTFKEAINNVIKHAQASEVWLTVLSEENRMTIRITDDGAGFDPGAAVHSKCNGLKNMADRMAGIGGRFTIRSEIGKGTKVEITFDLTRTDDTQFFRK